jgi:DNA-binding PadR family transcriptional regulator
MRQVVDKHVALLPLTEPVLLILLGLADQPRHGYAILQEVEKIRDGRVRLSTGTLYGTLHRLLEVGWIERVKEEDISRGKQAYRLTLGQRQLQKRSKPFEASHSGRQPARGAGGRVVHASDLPSWMRPLCGRDLILKQGATR